MAVIVEKKIVYILFKGWGRFFTYLFKPNGSLYLIGWEPLPYKLTTLLLTYMYGINPDN